MAMDVTSIISAITIPAGAAAVVGYLGKRVIESWLSRDLETFKSDLQRQALEHQVRFTRLHEKQAEIIAEVFSRLEALHQAFLLWTRKMKPGDSDTAKFRDRAVEAFNTFVDYYHPKAIWLDVDTCTAINSIVSEFWAVVFELGFDTDEHGFPRNQKAWGESYKKLKEEIPKARGLLDTRFREMLGVARGARGDTSP